MVVVSQVGAGPRPTSRLIQFLAPVATIVNLNVGSDDIELKRTAVRAPNQNAYAERFAQTIQQECLDHFVVLGEKHLRHIIQEFVAYYNEHRPHSSRGDLPLSMDKPPDPVESFGLADVVCHERLGGLLKYYERKAA